MNSKERTMAVLRGQTPDRVPVCLHNFLMAAREAGIPLESYLSDARATAEAHFRAWERYGHDCLLVDLDTTLLAEAMGAKRDFTRDEPGHIARPAIASLDEVDRLQPADPLRDGRIPVAIEAVSILARQLGGEVAIRGNADQCAFSLAGLLRGMEDFLVDLLEQPDHPGLARLLEVSYQTHLAAHRALAKAGAHFTSLGDSPAGPDLVSPRLFDRFARPYEERLVRDLAADGIFTVIHICGNTTAILDRLSAYPACGFELDYKTDARRAKDTAGRAHVLFGNVDPSGVLARGTPAQVRQSVRTLLEIWKPGAHFVLNAGCAIPATTPSDNLHAFLEAAHDSGAYG